MNKKNEISVRGRKKITIWIKIKYMVSLISKSLEEKGEEAYLRNLGDKHIRTNGYGKF